ncbi:putative secreted Zn-dependent protease [Pseudorhizobium tarimense]|uniref:Secreted Zn-dependent protease n=1 Tax=Pseudorhizobium tarimense TaxID=1079109 RepID=A0ABV2H357_9HYPH|nr:DUF922 domain-containing protein [Pseudorhizobium tarimense]MCJ8518167.1 DUF922 domain-containing protein [Pseudorhizobium tarimense]
MTATSAASDPQISKTYGYFSIGGKTAEDLDKELENRGPFTQTTGHRHPGATEIKFGGEVTYVERGGKCSVGAAKVTLSTHLILPRWSNRRRAEKDLRFIWDTLSSDIKRHEERHAEIARGYARALEKELLGLRPEKDCDVLQKQVGATTRRVLEAHDRDQLRFDRVESTNFDNRMMRLLKYRMHQNDG